MDKGAVVGLNKFRKESCFRHSKMVALRMSTCKAPPKIIHGARFRENYISVLGGASIVVAL